MRAGLFTVLIPGLLLLAACSGDSGLLGDEEVPLVERPPPPGPPSPSGALGDGQLQALVDEVHAASTTPALGAVVVFMGTVAESAVAGLRSIEADDEVLVGDSWHVGSLTKALTATLTAVLVEQAVISWDTKPTDVLTDIAADIHPDYADVTVADLLAHRSGVTADVFGVTEFERIADSADGSVIDKRRAWARDLLSIPAESPVGDFRFSDGGYIIVGSMLESVTGQPWEELVSSLVFDALAMPQTAFGGPGTPGVTDQPWGHANVNNNPVPVSPGPGSDNVIAFGPAGTVNTTFDDYARFMLAHINGANGIGGVVPAATFTFMHTAPNAGDYAIGWDVGEDPDGVGRFLTHDASNRLWFARVRLLPDLDAGYLIVSNSSISAAINAVDDLDSRLQERLQASQ